MPATLVTQLCSTALIALLPPPDRHLQPGLPLPCRGAQLGGAPIPILGTPTSSCLLKLCQIQGTTEPLPHPQPQRAAQPCQHIGMGLVKHGRCLARPAPVPSTPRCQYLGPFRPTRCQRSREIPFAPCQFPLLMLKRLDGKGCWMLQSSREEQAVRPWAAVLRNSIHSLMNPLP